MMETMTRATATDQDQTEIEGGRKKTHPPLAYNMIKKEPPPRTSDFSQAESWLVVVNLRC